MRFRILSSVLGLLGLAVLLSCSTSNSTSSGTGLLYVASQGDSLVSLFTFDLTTGVLSTTSSQAATGTNPVAMVMAPSGTALFVLNGPGGAAGSISAYTVNSDGSVKAGSGTTPTGTNANAIAIDPAGKFLFVANQGDFSTPSSGTISVFSVNGTSLTEVAGSPFPAAQPLATTGTGPTAVAVSVDSKFLYVANTFANTVSAYSINSTGALTELAGSPYPVGNAPSALTIGSVTGGFLYVTNSASNNVSAFAVCDKVTVSCADPNNPDGSLTVVPGSPFPAQLDPVALAIDPLEKYLYVVNRNASQISQFKIATGTGVISANTQATISTGPNPVSITIHPELTGQTTEFVYVANFGGTSAPSISAYKLDTTTGLLSLAEQPVASGQQPIAVASR